MRRLQRTIVVGCCVAAIAGSGCQSEWLLSELAHEEDTEYAAGYSEDGFRRLQKGMTFDEVRTVLGAPLEEYAIPNEPGATGWRYTRSPASKSHRVRALVFRQGRVAEVYREFYVD